MKKGQKKGISLVIVVVICFVLTLTVTTGFTVVCRYMSMAQKSVETLTFYITHAIVYEYIIAYCSSFVNIYIS